LQAHIGNQFPNYFEQRILFCRWSLKQNHFFKKTSDSSLPQENLKPWQHVVLVCIKIWLWVGCEPSHKLSNFRPKKYLQLCYGYATPIILSFVCQKLKTLKFFILVGFQIYV